MFHVDMISYIMFVENLLFEVKVCTNLHMQLILVRVYPLRDTLFNLLFIYNRLYYKHMLLYEVCLPPVVSQPCMPDSAEMTKLLVICLCAHQN